jgi:intracellular sulfur oxidation DsrE/DsrF family protein
MSDLTEPTNSRRAFLGRVATGAAAVVATGIPLETLHAKSAPPAAPWSDAWLDALKGKHRQFFDCVGPNEGFGLAYAMNFMNLNNEVYNLADHDISAVVGLRHLAMLMALSDPLWDKYKIGDYAKVTDPSTKEPAVRNIFTHGEALHWAGAAIPALSARGVTFTVCNVALTALSGTLGDKIGVSKDDAKKEWLAGLLPGMTVVPVGVMAVNRAQEHGCTYCYGG